MDARSADLQGAAFVGKAHSESVDPHAKEGTVLPRVAEESVRVEEVTADDQRRQGIAGPKLGDSGLLARSSSEDRRCLPDFFRDAGEQQWHPRDPSASPPESDVDGSARQRSGSLEVSLRLVMSNWRESRPASTGPNDHIGGPFALPVRTGRHDCPADAERRRFWRTTGWKRPRLCTDERLRFSAELGPDRPATILGTTVTGVLPSEPCVAHGNRM